MPSRLSLRKVGFRTLLRDFIARHPNLYFQSKSFLYHQDESNGSRFIRKETELVIEGFPSCANTFSCISFRQSQPESIEIVHHTHQYRQIIVGVKMNLPVIVLIRHPKDAIVSILSREFSQCNLSDQDRYSKLDNKLDDYLIFYSKILPFRDHYVVAPFSEVISSFGTVIEKINHKYGTHFVPFQDAVEYKKKVAQAISDLSKKWEEQDNSKMARLSKTSLPSKDKQKDKELWLKAFDASELASKLLQAENLFSLYCKPKCAVEE